MYGNKTRRLFIAIELPDHIIRKLKELQDSLKKEVKGKISWSKPENIHLTLIFLGDVSEEKVEGIKASIKGACEGINQFILLPEGIGCFPDIKNPRVIWVGIKTENNLLNDIFERLGAGLQDIGFEKESRKFHPHLTLGRIKYFEDRESLKKGIAGVHGIFIGEFEVKSVILFESRLKPEGAVHTKLKEIKLGG
ncbi:MAG: 2'-5' RNA ligase [Deltaproteobacteria bacterium GWC2_42_11]|nr:MAG: 2'-5' RNA ligase [Deltaproteobacteria bacterium GWC2_42_11]HBO83606.1 RNA 2',3'-cyclic phosphodiesterase [Deltaproteobacteria bacterium]